MLTQLLLFCVSLVAIDSDDTSLTQFDVPTVEDGLTLRWVAKLHAEKLVVCDDCSNSVIQFTSKRTLSFSGALYRNVVVDFAQLSFLSEEARMVAHNEADEYYKIRSGFIQVVASGMRSWQQPQTGYGKQPHLRYVEEILQTTETVPRKSELRRCSLTIDAPVIFIQRVEYANVYHQYTDWYNALIMERLIRLELDEETTAQDVQFYLFDLHESSSLDIVWSKVFGPEHASLSAVRQFAQEKRVVCFRTLALSARGSNTRFDHKSPTRDVSPGSSDIMELVRKRFIDKLVNAPDDIRVSRDSCIIIARRNYVAHPRNPSGRVDRQWANETMLQLVVRDAIGTNCELLDFATMSFEQQFQRLIRTQLLIGAHGAALTLLVFTPPDAKIIEVSVAPQYHFENYAHHSGRGYVNVPGRRTAEGKVAFAPEEMRRALLSV